MAVDGKPVKALLHADKNGYFYAFDRTNGRLLVSDHGVNSLKINGLIS
jgi:glucose dehydrogenase